MNVVTCLVINITCKHVGARYKIGFKLDSEEALLADIENPMGLTRILGSKY